MTVPSAVMNRTCPLCAGENARDFYRDGTRDYLRCPACRLIFVPPAQQLDPGAQKARYDLHENSPSDERYRTFLSRLFMPLNDRLPAKSSGLDFGCGPGPTLSLMFEEAGHTVEVYDRFYAPDTSVFDKKYDFITATEVAEHLSDPKTEWTRLWRCLKSGGLLGLMTKMADGHGDFGGWYYKNDPTHVCFYSRTTFQWLAGRWEARLELIGDDVMIFGKQKDGL